MGILVFGCLKAVREYGVGRAEEISGEKDEIIRKSGERASHYLVSEQNMNYVFGFFCGVLVFFQMGFVQIW